MQLFTIVLAIQIFFAAIILNTSANSSPAKTIRHSLKQVLGISSFLVQDNTSDSTSDQPTDTLTPDQNQPTDTPILTDQSQSPTDTPTPSQSDLQIISPTEAPTLSPDETSLVNTSDNATTPAPSGELTPSPTSTDNITETATSTTDATNTLIPTPENQDTGIVDTSTTTTNLSSSPLNNAVVNSDTAISTPSDISTDSIQQAHQQDVEIHNASNPQQKTQTLLQAAKENVISVTDTIQQNNYSTEAFLTERITDEVSSAITNAQAQTTQQKSTLNEVKLFCKQADLTLKTQQLLVPQDLEQDIEITRGLCNNIQ